MLRQFLVGSLVSGCNIAIHALGMVAIINAAQITQPRGAWRPSLFLLAVMIATVSFLMTVHFFEVLIWALAYRFMDAAPPEADLMYFAFSNYTTLGYGDIIPVERWRLIGPMTAMNGVLLFGWSTAVIFEVLRKTILTRAR